MSKGKNVRKKESEWKTRLKQGERKKNGLPSSVEPKNGVRLRLWPEKDSYSQLRLQKTS